jgi:hypothetical protein
VTLCLVGPNWRAGHRRKGRRRLRPAIKLNSRVADLYATRNLDGGTRETAVLVSFYAQVGALHLPLLLSVGRVDAHLLDAHQVLAGGDFVGQAELEVLLVAREPALVGAVPRDHGAELVDLEPVAGSVVVADIAGGLGEVDLPGVVSVPGALGVIGAGLSSYGDRARVVDAEVQVEVEAHNVLASRDDGRLWLATVVPRTLVAAEVGAGEEVVVGRHEAIVVLAHVLEGAGPHTVEHQVWEEEVG